MERFIKVLIIISVLVSGMAIAGCSSCAAPGPVVEPGSPAPDFQLPSLDGQAISLSSLRGRPVMLNFWATWCPPCLVEMPFIQEVYEDEAWQEQGLVILAINLNEPPARVKEFMEDNGLTFTVLLDNGVKVAEAYDAVRIVPVTYFIDKDGIIKDRKIGLFRSKEQIDWRLVNSILVDG